MSPKDKDEPRCSFCGKPQDEVLKFISGPSVRICDDCVRVCNDILAEDGLAERLGAPRQSFGQNAGSFTCPNCQTAFLLHSQHIVTPDRRSPTAEDDPQRRR